MSSNNQTITLTKKDKEIFLKAAQEYGGLSLSGFLRMCAVNFIKEKSGVKFEVRR